LLKLPACNIRPVTSSGEASHAPLFDGRVRLMLPLKHGVILPPFQLQHHLPSCMYSFFVKDAVYHSLMAQYETFCVVFDIVVLSFYGYFVSFLSNVLMIKVIFNCKQL